jgi:hypothetical protein
VLQQKIEMLDSLLEIEIAYTMLKTKSDGGSNVHPLDAHYAKLNTDIEVLHWNSDEFQLLKQYVQNTHAATHTQYDLEIFEVCLVTSYCSLVCGYHYVYLHLQARNEPRWESAWIYMSRGTIRPPLWSSGQFLATDTEVLGSIPGASRFSEKRRIWNGVHSAS